MDTGLKPVWAGCHMRLDPTRLPQAVCYAVSEQPGDVNFTISKRGVVIRRTLANSRLPVSMALPANVFQGVAARAIEDADGEVTVTLELLHADRSLSVPLLVASDLDDIAADWRTWADAYMLPMLIFEADGVARPLDECLGEISTGPMHDRRKRSLTKYRRPRFLARPQGRQSRPAPCRRR